MIDCPRGCKAKASDKEEKKIDLTGTEIERLNAPLYIDVTCYECKRAVTLSNSIEIDGRKYCHRHGTTKQDVLYRIERN